MGFRFRKSINLGGGFRVNLSKSGVGYSWGTKGMRFTKTAKGTSRKTLSIPGTGISNTSESSAKTMHTKERKNNNTSKQTTENITNEGAVMKKGRFANFVKAQWRWILTVFLALMVLGAFPSFSSFLFLLVIALILPIEKWQNFLSKYLKGKLRGIAAGILAVVALLATPNNSSTPTDGLPEESTIVAESTETIHVHDFSPATCLEAKLCSSCGEKEGEALGHTWVDATCLRAKYCSVCNIDEGEVGDHNWEKATCLAAQTCCVCSKTEGGIGDHAWVDATCNAPKTCSVCNETEGNPLGHTWEDATCMAPKTCTVCNEKDGFSVDCKYQNHFCVYCGDEEAKVWIPKSGKRYHHDSGCGNMKNPTEVYISTAIARGFTDCQNC